MRMKLTTPHLKQEIKELQDYLGVRCNYSSDYYPDDPDDRFLFKELIKLKLEFYKRDKSSIVKIDTSKLVKLTEFF